jgi:hypothetical protein
MNDTKLPPHGASDYLLAPTIIIEPRPPVARMPRWVTACKVSTAVALLAWALLG